jgi:hypothetical protein
MGKCGGYGVRQANRRCSGRRAESQDAQYPTQRRNTPPEERPSSGFVILSSRPACMKSLDATARPFIGENRNVWINRAKREVWLSAIFDF